MKVKFKIVNCKDFLIYIFTTTKSAWKNVKQTTNSDCIFTLYNAN